MSPETSYTQPATAQEAVAAVATARRRHSTWASWAPDRRRSWAKRFLLAARHERIRFSSYARLDCGLGHDDIAVDQQSVLLPRRLLRAASAAKRARQADQQVVVGLSDQAAPLSSLLHTVLPPILAGQCVITALDPATVPLGSHLHHLARQSGLPDEVWQLLPGQESYISGVLSEHADSSALACCVPRTAPNSVTPASMLAVRSDAYVRPAVRAALRACFTGAGRHCTATPLVMVHERHHDAFLALFIAATQRLADHRSTTTPDVLGTLICSQQVDAVRA
ncbi:aldehyde dehydrogenase family protein, partial [Streptomyces sp. NPDC002784]